MFTCMVFYIPEFCSQMCSNRFNFLYEVIIIDNAGCAVWLTYLISRETFNFRDLLTIELLF